jgi:hypothetical protein
MAIGRLPALVTFCLASVGGLSWGQGQAGREGGCSLPRALEAVAGTLRRLTITFEIRGRDWPAGACYELGAAIGKLRRLMYLKLGAFYSGRAYHAVGRGLAASGGCPELLRLEVVGLIREPEWLTYEPSLIVPSVRDVMIKGRCTEEEALLWCCGLVQAGYKHRLDLDFDLHRPRGESDPFIRDILCHGGIHCV